MSERHNNSGITIQNQISVLSNKNTLHSIEYQFFQAIFVFLAAVAPIYSWVHALRLHINDALFLFGTVVTIFFFAGFALKRKARWIFISVYFALVIGIGYYAYPYFENGFYCLENAVLKFACPYFGLIPVQYMVFREPTLSTTMLMLAIVQFVAAIAFVEVYHHYMRTIYLFVILLFEGALMIIGIVPPAFWMFLLLFLYVCMSTMDQVPGGVIQKNYDHRRQTKEYSLEQGQGVRTRVALVMLVVLMGIFVITRLLITPQSYASRTDIIDRKHKIQSAVENFSYSDFMKEIKRQWSKMNPFDLDLTFTSGGLDSGKIGNVGSISFDGETALQVTVDENVSYLYLKGFAGANYTGTEWAPLTSREEKDFKAIQDTYGNERYTPEAMLFTWYKLWKRQANGNGTKKPLNFRASDVYVRYQNANKSYMYAPYIGKYDGFGDVECVDDLYFAPTSPQKEYLYLNTYLEYDVDSTLNDIAKAVSARDNNPYYFADDSIFDYYVYESAYSAFVDDVYTRIPKDGLDRLKTVKLNYTDGSNENRYDMIQEVIQYLSDHTEYSLSPGLPKPGQDVTEYFLFDAQKGFCSHYASAAVLILRNNGVPARYVEGYVVTRQDIKDGVHKDGTSVVDVHDYNAHAWIEVYYDGIGWIPVEVTKGYNFSGITSELPNIQEMEEPTVEPTVEPQPSHKEKPTLTTKPTPTEKPTSELTPKPVTGSASQIEDEDSSQESSIYWSKGHIILWVILGLVIFIICFILSYQIRKKVLRSALMAGDSKHQIVRQYQEVERILAQDHIYHKRNETYEHYIEYVTKYCKFLPEGFECTVIVTLKAAFSNQPVTKEEAQQVYEFYLSLRENYYQSNPKIKIFFMKYWKVI